MAPELSSLSDQHDGMHLLIVLATGASATDEAARRLFTLLPLSGEGTVEVVAPGRLLATLPARASPGAVAIALAAHRDVAWIEQRIVARVLNAEATFASSLPATGAANM